MMREIYEKAQGVHIWLGQADEDGNKAKSAILKSLRARKKQAKQPNLLAPEDKSPLQRLRYWERDLDIKDWSEEITALLKLLRRPWFRRVWIIQEAAVSRRASVHCGGLSMPWEDFRSAVAYAIELGYFTQSFPQAYLHLLRIDELRSLTGGLNFEPALDRLCQFRGFLSTDPRDKAFALYGLLDPKEVERLPLVPDYDVDVRTLFRQLAIHFWRVPTTWMFSVRLTCTMIMSKCHLGSHYGLPTRRLTTSTLVGVQLMGHPLEESLNPVPLQLGRPRA